MCRYYFENLITGEVFYKDEENPVIMQKFLKKVQYSDKINYLGSRKL